VLFFYKDRISDIENCYSKVKFSGNNYLSLQPSTLVTLSQERLSSKDDALSAI